MIRIVSPSVPLKEMLIVELQGKVTIPPTLIDEAEEERSQAIASGAKHTRDEMPLEVPLGQIVKDARSAKRRTLRIGTLSVDGSCGDYADPLLVLRRVGSAAGTGTETREAVCRSPESECCLLEEWLEAHPEEMTMKAACDAADPASTKVYELVGVADRYVHINSKPVRIFT